MSDSEEYSGSSTEQASDVIEADKEVFDQKYAIVKLPFYVYPKITTLLEVPCILYKTNSEEEATQWVAICKGNWKHVTCEEKNYIICVDPRTKQMRINVNEQKINFTKSLFLEDSWEFQLEGIKYTMELNQNDFKKIQERNLSLVEIKNDQLEVEEI